MNTILQRTAREWIAVNIQLLPLDWISKFYRLHNIAIWVRPLEMVELIHIDKLDNAMLQIERSIELVKNKKEETALKSFEKENAFSTAEMDEELKSMDEELKSILDIIEPDMVGNSLMDGTFKIRKPNGHYFSKTQSELTKRERQYAIMYKTRFINPHGYASANPNM